MNNAAPKDSYPIIVIGAGAGGLVVAIGATKAGKKVLLIEKGTYGGDCTNFGCIPSKSLIASGACAAALKEGPKLGIRFPIHGIEANEALARVRAVVAQIRSREEPEALSQMGLETITGTATFQGPHVLKVNGTLVHGKQIVIAAGSSPLIPPIAGLDGTPFLTNETIFDLREIPRSLCVIGGGPIGCELSQAFSRLGAQVSLIHEHPALLNKEEPGAQDVISNTFKTEGITLHLGTRVTEVSYRDGHFLVLLETGQTIESQELLVAVGRKPNVSSLGLDVAGVHYTEKGIAVDAYGRTSQPHIWAVGDVVGGPFFTHWAESQARSVLTSLLLPFPFRRKIETQAIPRVTFTDPEVASIGLLEKEARERHRVAVYHVPFGEVDRALTYGRTEGFIQIVTKKWSSKILGCTLVAPRAGEMLGELALAMRAGIPLRKLAGLIHPYPTYNLAIRKAADMWLTQTILPIFRRNRGD